MVCPSSMVVQFMYVSIECNCIKSYRAYFNVFACSRCIARSEPLNKGSCLANRWSERYPRRHLNLVKVHNAWFDPKGGGHNGRNFESRSRQRGSGDSQRTRAKTILSELHALVGGFSRSSGTGMLALFNPETWTKHMTCTLNAVLSTVPFNLTKSRRSGEVELVPTTFLLKWLVWKQYGTTKTIQM